MVSASLIAVPDHVIPGSDHRHRMLATFTEERRADRSCVLLRVRVLRVWGLSSYDRSHVDHAKEPSITVRDNHVRHRLHEADDAPGLERRDELLPAVRRHPLGPLFPPAQIHMDRPVLAPCPLHRGKRHARDVEVQLPRVGIRAVTEHEGLERAGDLGEVLPHLLARPVLLLLLRAQRQPRHRHLRHVALCFSFPRDRGLRHRT
mmetsp:Transcript_20300/g.48440  ORF Transcript_20300/g.48440 Transcript_20300/m.48440 type:complete len:204 (+) Transcript_20300:312-923(+)